MSKVQKRAVVRSSDLPKMGQPAPKGFRERLLDEDLNRMEADSARRGWRKPLGARRQGAAQGQSVGVVGEGVFGWWAGMIGANSCKFNKGCDMIG